ncbi:hypothetical protein [Desulfonema magnum]|uniref:Type II secretion system protein GspC N-terminal domain-containing protein n=1 Tax=Desulfonema magnum TaxID=45655 RepID=A0A975GKA4_9BACT|nr:hypothetical protein [Desulfonema magnum]QTA84506.1 Uncharacterized protein dnm_005030 [Desulfonema magnum]
MFSKIWLMNIVLAGCAVFFGIKAHDVWVAKEKSVPAIPVTQKSVAQPGKRILNRSVPRESVYKSVTNANLFSPDRAEFIPEEPEPEPEVKELSLLGKKITLHGVVMMDDYKSALITNPKREADERKNKWVKVGDTIDDDLEVAEIRKESILLAQGDKKYEVPLYDKSKTRTREKVKKSAKPTVVVSESQKASSKQGTSEKAGVSAPEFEMIDTPFGKMKRRVRKPEPKAAVEKKEAPSEPEFEIVDTPFGKIKRRKN